MQNVREVWFLLAGQKPKTSLHITRSKKQSVNVKKKKWFLLGIKVKTKITKNRYASANSHKCENAKEVDRYVYKYTNRSKKIMTGYTKHKRQVTNTLHIAEISMWVSNVSSYISKICCTLFN